MCVIEIREKYGRIYTRLFIWITRSGVGMAGEKGEKKKAKNKAKDYLSSLEGFLYSSQK